jgi:hypothetical protein
MLFGFFLPRLTLFCLWLTGYVGRAYTTTLWPLLGFFFLPYTTLAYAIAVNAGWGMQGLGLILFAFGLLLDFGVIGGGASSRRRPWRRNSVKREDFYGPPT